MTRTHQTLGIGLAVLLAAPAMAAQDAAPNDGPDPAKAVETEREVEQEARSIEAQMREAEERLAEAAARVAELSSRRLPTISIRKIERGMRHVGRPVIGVTIGSSGEDRPVDGVTVRAVTPGSGAAEAGLRAGDIITAVNDESLAADSDAAANEKMLDFMAGVEEGDSLDIEYRRDGREATVEVEPQTSSAFSFSFPADRAWRRTAPAAPAAPGPRWFGYFMRGGNWGDMEMVSLTEELGRYFGTDSGLLVVRAPADDNLQLQDGDVIQSIDGREPNSVSHAMRILGSYQGGETLEIEIMRDKERETLSIEMPDRRQGFRRHHEFRAPRHGAAMQVRPM